MAGLKFDAAGGRGLIGRSDELRLVAGLFERASRGGAQVLLIEGEPGLGKSALMRATQSLAAHGGFQILSACADELAGRRSFGLWTDWLGKRLPAGAPGAAAEHPEGTGADAEFAASEAAIEAVEALSGQGPVALLLEDLHWADAASLYVLRRLIRHVAPLPLALLATLRPLPRPAQLAALLADLGNRSRLTLSPLQPAAVDELVEAVVGARPGPQLRVQAAMAGGNPLFVLELLDALRAERALSERPDPGGGRRTVEIERATPPPSLRLTVLHRLSYLSPSTVRALSLAAVLGPHFRAAHLAELAQRPVAELVTPLREALAAGLLVEDGAELAFRHELVRDALYGDLPLAVRMALHRDVARVFDRQGAAAGLLAEHLLRGAEPGDAQAVEQLRTLAARLLPATPATAVELLQRAAGLAGPESAALAELQADLAVALLWSGRAEEGESACRTVLAGALEPRRRSSLRQSLVESLLHRGQPAAVLDEVAAGLREPDLDALERARLEGIAANARLFLGDLEGAASQARRAARAGRSLNDTPLTVRALVVQSLLAAHAGNVSSAVTIAGRAVDIGGADGRREVQESMPHLTQAMFLIDTDRFQSAIERLAQGRAAQEALGGRGLLPVHHVCLGFAHFWSGRWDEATAEIETGIELAEETGTGWRVAARGLRAVVALARGDRATAGRWLDAGEAELAAGEAGYRLAWLRWARGLWAEAGGPDSPVSPWIEALVATADTGRSAIDLATTGPTLVRWALATGRRPPAEAVTGQLDRLAALNPEAAGIAAAASACRGLLAGDGRRLAEAAAVYRSAGRPLEEALAAEAAALAAAAAGLTAEAGAWLGIALEVYHRLEAVTFAARASGRLATMGVLARGSRVRRPRPAFGWGSLTVSEQRVLRLVVERRTNAEIGRSLLVSRRTVETHVAHILTKLGLRSRVELCQAAARQFGWRLRIEQSVQDGQQAQPADEATAAAAAPGDLAGQGRQVVDADGDQHATSLRRRAGVDIRRDYGFF